MSSKGKKFSKKTKQPEMVEVWGCNNPLVKDGTMMCDGNCSMCGYKYVEIVIKKY